MEENGEFICYEVSGTILSSVSAFCFMQVHVSRFEMSPDHVRLVSATFLVNLMFTNYCEAKPLYFKNNFY